MLNILRANYFARRLDEMNSLSSGRSSFGIFFILVMIERDRTASDRTRIMYIVASIMYPNDRNAFLIHFICSLSCAGDSPSVQIKWNLHQVNVHLNSVSNP